MKLTTAKHTEWWKSRDIDWKKDYLDTDQHPHRTVLMELLKRLKWRSLLEVGCASGPNLRRIQQSFPGCQLGGIDPSPGAIETAQRFFGHSVELQVGTVEDIFFSDKATDVLLTDMALIYVGPQHIKKAIREIRRVTRNHVIFSEFHSSSFLASAALWAASGYFAHNFPRLLEAEGFYNVELRKMRERDWPGGDPQKTFGYFITASI